jgi:8-oxo-dGTP diphosphatase
MEYNYCPICGSKLITKNENGAKRHFCKVCNRFIYKNPVPVVAGVIPDSENRILLIQRGIEPCKGSWALPSGFIETNETPQECIVREMKEETGLDTQIKEVLGIYQQQGWRYSSIITIAFILNIEGGKPKAGDDADNLSFFSSNKIPEIPFSSHRKILKDYFNAK